MTTQGVEWSSANQRYLTAALAEVRVRLERAAAPPETSTPLGSHPELEQAMRERDAAEAALPAAAALDRLVSSFDLSAFERGVLLLCAGMELDSRFPLLCAAAQGDTGRPYPTFALAMAVLPEPHWSALLPEAPLRRWRLVEVAAGTVPLTTAPLRVDEPILHYLRGLPCRDERLAELVWPAQSRAALTAPESMLADRLAQHWSGAQGQALAVQLCGGDPDTREAIAREACRKLGVGLRVLAAHRLPPSVSELDALLRLWEREAVLGGSVLVLETEGPTALDAAREQAAYDLVEKAQFPLAVAAPERRRSRRVLPTLDLPRAGAGEQRELWSDALGIDVDGQLDSVVSQFRLRPAQIAAIGARVRSDGPGNPLSPAGVARIWEGCRAEARPRIDDLAQRVESRATWDDLVLPDEQTETLRLLMAQARHRYTVYERWGFAAPDGRGLGVSALFAGASGTGKTLAAEVLANALGLDLYRIDLSQVVSKYIGETEKNLRRIFDAAESGGAVVLGDECDALFGKRSEVKDSHDRYANIEIAYLLQRIETYRGLVILTTNMKQALDPSFLRRLRFVVEFPFPDATRRAAIWQRIFPPAVPTEGLDAARLARLNVSGGNIRNIALGAAFLAADAGGPVRMEHLLRAAKVECAKLDKPLTEAEVRGWR